MTTYRLCGECGGLKMVSSPIRVNLDYVEAGDDASTCCQCKCLNIPNREDEIEGFLERLGDIWRENPDIRLGQLIEMGIRGEAVWEGLRYLFYIEDGELLEALEEAWLR